MNVPPIRCPFVTTVGGTFGIPEVGASFTGGGFSRYFAQPAYQKLAVDGFLTRLEGKYNGLFKYVRSFDLDSKVTSLFYQLKWSRLSRCLSTS